jgi:hypothetical protein
LAKHFGAPMTLTVFGTVCLAGCLVYIARVVVKLQNTGAAEAQVRWGS